MDRSEIKSYASRTELHPFALQRRDQSPGAGSEAYGRRQLLPLLILLLWKRDAARRAWGGRTGLATPLGMVNNVEP